MRAGNRIFGSPSIRRGLGSQPGRTH
jgi:hypothetical protein